MLECRLGRLARLTEEIDYKAGTEVIREGEKGREFFVVVSGQLEVLRKGKRVAVVGPGDHVGEFALLSGSTRNATVKALEPVHLLWMNGRAFTEAIDAIPGLWRKIAVALADRAEKSVVVQGRGAVEQPVVLFCCPRLSLTSSQRV